MKHHTKTLRNYFPEIISLALSTLRIQSVLVFTQVHDEEEHDEQTAMVLPEPVSRHLRSRLLRADGLNNGCLLQIQF